MGEAFNPQAIVRTKTVEMTVSGASSLTQSFSWDTPFPNSNYQITAIQNDSSNSNLNNIRIRGTAVSTPSTFFIRLTNDSAVSITTDIMVIGVWTP